MSIYSRVQYYSGNPANDSAGGVTQTEGAQQNFPHEGWHHVARMQFRAYGRSLDIKTNITSDSLMYMCKFEGYLYSQTLFLGYACGYTYHASGASMILAKETTQLSGHNLHSYRAGSHPNGGYNSQSTYFGPSTGYPLCFRLEKGTNAYSEGYVDFSMWTHGQSNTGVTVTASRHHQADSNYWST